jgi:hypothetical protein
MTMNLVQRFNNNRNANNYHRGSSKRADLSPPSVSSNEQRCQLNIGQDSLSPREQTREITGMTMQDTAATGERQMEDDDLSRHLSGLSRHCALKLIGDEHFVSRRVRIFERRAEPLAQPL